MAEGIKHGMEKEVTMVLIVNIKDVVFAAHF